MFVYRCLAVQTCQMKAENGYSSSELSRKETIKKYFYDGYSYLEIMKVLSKYHDISIYFTQTVTQNLGFIQE